MNQGSRDGKGTRSWQVRGPKNCAGRVTEPRSSKKGLMPVDVKGGRKVERERQTRGKTPTQVTGKRLKQGGKPARWGLGGTMVKRPDQMWQPGNGDSKEEMVR